MCVVNECIINIGEVVGSGETDLRRRVGRGDGKLGREVCRMYLEIRILYSI